MSLLFSKHQQDDVKVDKWTIDRFCKLEKASIDQSNKRKFGKLDKG